MTEPVPPAVEAAIRSDLRPVRRLSTPARRVLWLAPVAAVTLMAAPRVFALREDAGLLGWPLTWGVSIVQTCAGVVLVALALREAIPGRGMRSPSIALAGGLGLAFTVIVTVFTWWTSPIGLDAAAFGWIGRACFAGTLAGALPMLAGAAALASRAFVLRPWAVGALYGLGAGLAADAGWRLFCHYSDPGHVFPTHTGGVLASMVAGMLIALTAQRVSAARPLRR